MEDIGSIRAQVQQGLNRLDAVTGSLPQLLPEFEASVKNLQSILEGSPRRDLDVLVGLVSDAHATLQVALTSANNAQQVVNSYLGSI